MEKSGINQIKNQRYNFIQMPEFKNSKKPANKILSFNQIIPKI